eukprot:TRINITY_DN29901_c0_g1_i2.p1 TRINITY_DN29901_c0_g1~~TRINITY_DN29901_c0_g1_i2.p1  ORF type:complete len:526 (-),score=115.18 TRINITY_DN29901_c0_g1_i2:168-1745(-)
MVFHRYAQDDNGYFMVSEVAAGVLRPPMGTTDGWTHAILEADWDRKRYSVKDWYSWPSIIWTHRLWYNHRGTKLDVSNVSDVTQRVQADQIWLQTRPFDECPDAPWRQRPLLSLLHVRWGGDVKPHASTVGDWGWGAAGSTVSNVYINHWENHLFWALGPRYEIFSIFVETDEELARISAPMMRLLLRGTQRGALYFFWPLAMQSGHYEEPGYLNQARLLETMTGMEAAGVPTRFPHESHLYRIFLSKEWVLRTTLMPSLRVPPSTAVSRQAIVQNTSAAALGAARALAAVATTRLAWASEAGGEPSPAAEVLLPLPPEEGKELMERGVAKVGFSWEAHHVYRWRNLEELEDAFEKLTQLPANLHDSVIVQGWMDFDVEMRHFIIEPDLAVPASLKPRHRIYDVFEKVNGNLFTEFKRLGRDAALARTFADDEAAMADAEQKADALIVRWLQWLQAQTHELPPVLRVDIVAKRVGPGSAAVATMELTELGACTLGWQTGPSVVFGAMLNACLGTRGRTFGEYKLR